MIELGIDVGGTFTDVLALDRERGEVFAAYKLPSTPTDPSRAATRGVDRHLARHPSGAAAVYHGTTVGTNTLIEKKGGTAVLVTTRGFRDVLALRRQARPRLYDLHPRVSPPLIERCRRLEVDERVHHDGRVGIALSASEIERVIERIRDPDVTAVAVSLLHAYANDVHERALGEAIARARPDLLVTLSSEVCREFREFERTSTAVVNAYIGPCVARYLDTLEGELTRRGVAALSIVKSNGGLTSAANARRYPVHLIESGPAAGVIAAATLGQAEGVTDLIAFDMGGTTAKAGVIRGGEPRLVTEFHADRLVDGVDHGGYPIKSPVIDVIEIGAGGGSIAAVDRAGVLKVGPHSAGADPGPAAYDRGGTQPTVTDAHVIVGHVAPDAFGGGDLELRPELAEAAVEREVARRLGWPPERAAWGILRLATAHMAEMVRLATVRRGLDPRDFTLVAFGGAGPLHAGEIARSVGIPRVMVPPCPGLFSAIGTLLGERRHDLVQTMRSTTSRLEPGRLRQGYAALEVRARELISREARVGAAGWRLERQADLRFEGQLFELTLPVPVSADPDGALLEGTFRDAHRRTYGYDLPEHPVELTGLRLVARAPVSDGGWPSVTAPAGARRRGRRRVHDVDGSSREVPVVGRDELDPGQRLAGPAIVEDLGATVRVLEGQQAEVRPSGVLLIEEGGGAARGSGRR